MLSFLFFCWAQTQGPLAFFSWPKLWPNFDPPKQVQHPEQALKRGPNWPVTSGPNHQKPTRMPLHMNQLPPAPKQASHYKPISLLLPSCMGFFLPPVTSQQQASLPSRAVTFLLAPCTLFPFSFHASQPPVTSLHPCSWLVCPPTCLNTIINVCAQLQPVLAC